MTAYVYVLIPLDADVTFEGMQGLAAAGFPVRFIVRIDDLDPFTVGGDAAAEQSRVVRTQPAGRFNNAALVAVRAERWDGHRWNEGPCAVSEERTTERVRLEHVAGNQRRLGWLTIAW